MEDFLSLLEKKTFHILDRWICNVVCSYVMLYLCLIGANSVKLRSRGEGDGRGIASMHWTGMRARCKV